MPSLLDDNYERLRQVDEYTGANCTEVYDIARKLSGRIDHAIIVPMYAAELTKHNLSTVGETLVDQDGDDIVTFGVDLEEYEVFINGVLSGRFQQHKRYIKEFTGNLVLTDILEVVLAHEIGHVVQIQQLREEFGDAAAFDNYCDEGKRDIWALPLAVPSTVAIEWWDANKGGYRSAMETAGYSSESFFEKIQENSIAYGNIPHELNADNFAFSIITAKN